MPSKTVKMSALAIVCLLGLYLSVDETKELLDADPVSPNLIQTAAGGGGGGKKTRVRGSHASIPHIIWFLYDQNILVTKNPPDLYDNVLKIEQLHKKAWDQTQAPVNFVGSAMCTRSLDKIEPDLVNYYRKETNMNNRDDMCRAAILYLNGGYYFDVGTQITEAVKEEEGKKLVATLKCDGECFDRSFVASGRKNPLFQRALKNMLTMYQEGGEGALGDDSIGNKAMTNALKEMPESERIGANIQSVSR